MKKIAIMAALAVALFSCNSNKTADAAQGADEQATETAEAVETPSVIGQWRLVDYPGDNNEVQTMGDDANYLLTFQADGFFGMSTDCNSMGGEYKIDGDSIKFDNLASTQMECPAMEVEKAMARILPQVDTYAVLNDTILLLRSDMRAMATFNKAKEEK